MFERTDSEVLEERNSRKEPLTDDDAQLLIDGVETVWVAKGKKIREIPAREAGLDDLKGPTGNFRAPMVRVAGDLLVGFHPDTLGRLVESA